LQYRVCEKNDWRNHKKHCGKQRIAKKLPGTIHDPNWFQPDVPEEIRLDLPSTSNGFDQMASLGFGSPARAALYSAALQRQVALLTVDKMADYFLFDEMDRPIRFATKE
jgi:hypothetical protein